IIHEAYSSGDTGRLPAALTRLWTRFAFLARLVLDAPLPGARHDLYQSLGALSLQNRTIGRRAEHLGGSRLDIAPKSNPCQMLLARPNAAMNGGAEKQTLTMGRIGWVLFSRVCARRISMSASSTPQPDGPMAERLDFIGFGAAAMQRLARASPSIMRHIGPAMTRFYDRVEETPQVS